MDSLKKNLNKENDKSKKKYTKPTLIKYKRLKKISAKMPAS